MARLSLLAADAAPAAEAHARGSAASDAASEADTALRPPEHCEHVLAALQRLRASAASAMARQRRRAPPAGGEEEVARNAQLREEARARASAAHGPLAAMRSARARLPAAREAGSVLAALRQSRVVVVSGETGCGKTTQVPQFILDDADAAGVGARCNIVVTQPRRLAAVGVATRVAAERGERLGATVGYSVRLESRRSAATRLLFCTTGVLLRRLHADPELCGVSHVVVDEVHERSVDSDFVLVVLRALLDRRPALRLVLMSATINADLFATYFAAQAKPRAHPGLGEASCAVPAPAPLVHIPGLTFPVEDHFLEDIMATAGYELRETSRFAAPLERVDRRAREAGFVAAEAAGARRALAGGFSGLTCRR